MGTHIRVKSPTRVDLAGGTLDLWPVHSFLRSAKTINLAISIFTYCEIKQRDDAKIHIRAPAVKLDKIYNDLEEALRKNDKEISFLYPHLDYWRPEGGFEVYFHSESPIGGGLGGSSSLTASCIKAFAHFCQRDLTEQEIVYLAHNLEANILQMPTGTQDYYPPIYGGLLCLDYRYDACHVEKLPTDVFKTINDHFLLVYTGSPHHSGFNNWQVLKSFIEGDSNTRKNMEALKVVSESLYHSLKEKNYKSLPAIFKEEFKYRTALSKAFSSPEIEKLEAISSKAGAGAVKICGAGGGGCVFVWVDPDIRAKVKLAIEEAGFKVLSAQPVEEGSRLELL